MQKHTKKSLVSMLLAVTMVITIFFGIIPTAAVAGPAYPDLIVTGVCYRGEYEPSGWGSSTSYQGYSGQYIEVFNMTDHPVNLKEYEAYYSKNSQSWVAVNPITKYSVADINNGAIEPDAAWLPGHSVGVIWIKQSWAAITESVRNRTSADFAAIMGIDADYLFIAENTVAAIADTGGHAQRFYFQNNGDGTRNEVGLTKKGQVANNGSKSANGNIWAQTNCTDAAYYAYFTTTAVGSPDYLAGGNHGHFAYDAALGYSTGFAVTKSAQGGQSALISEAGRLRYTQLPAIAGTGAAPVISHAHTVTEVPVGVTAPVAIKIDNVESELGVLTVELLYKKAGSATWTSANIIDMVYPLGADLSLNNRIKVSGEISVEIPASVFDGINEVEYYIRAIDAGGKSTDSPVYTIGYSSFTDVPVIVKVSIPNGAVGVAYSETLVTYGAAPITWALAGGNLPDGLALDSGSGLVSGTPSAAGAFTFTVEAENIFGKDAREYTIFIYDITGGATGYPDLIVTGVTYRGEYELQGWGSASSYQGYGGQYIEVYNTTNQPINLKEYEAYYTKSSQSWVAANSITKYSVADINKGMVEPEEAWLPAHSVGVIWIKQSWAAIPESVRNRSSADFAAIMGIDADYLFIAENTVAAIADTGGHAQRFYFQNNADGTRNEVGLTKSGQIVKDGPKNANANIWATTKCTDEAYFAYFFTTAVGSLNYMSGGNHGLFAYDKALGYSTGFAVAQTAQRGQSAVISEAGRLRYTQLPVVSDVELSPVIEHTQTVTTHPQNSIYPIEIEIGKVTDIFGVGCIELFYREIGDRDWTGAALFDMVYPLGSDLSPAGYVKYCDWLTVLLPQDFVAEAIDIQYYIKVVNVCGISVNSPVYTITEGDAIAPTIVTATLPNGTANEPYSEELMSYGSRPIIWSLYGGSLPEGLTLDGNTGVVSGKPMVAGTYTFTVKAENDNGFDVREVSVVIVNEIDRYLSVELLTPLELLEKGDVFGLQVKVINNSPINLVGVTVRIDPPYSAIAVNGRDSVTTDIAANAGVTVDFSYIMVEGGREAFYATAELDGKSIKATNAVSVAGSGFFRGDNHSHTLHSDGSGTMAENVNEAYNNKWLSWLYATDHNTILHKADAAIQTALKEGSFINLADPEFTAYNGHALTLDINDNLVTQVTPNGLGATVDEADKLTGGSYGNLAKWQAIVDDVTGTRNGIFYMCHPYSATLGFDNRPGVMSDDTIRDIRRYTGLEIWNGAYDSAGNHQSREAWDKVNSMGTGHYNGISVSDAHNPADIGRAYVKAFLPGLAEDNIHDALKKGNYFGSNGPEIRFNIDGAGISDTLNITSGSKVANFNINVYSPVYNLTKIEIIKNTITGKYELNREVVYSYAFAGDKTNTFDRTIQLSVKPGEFYRVEATSESALNSANSLGYAITNNIWVELADKSNATDVTNLQYEGSGVTLNKLPAGVMYLNVADGAVLDLDKLTAVVAAGVSLEKTYDQGASFINLKAVAEDGTETNTELFVMGAIPEIPFAAESLTLQPGNTARDINFNWYSDRNSDNNASSVKIAMKSAMNGNAFPTDAIIVEGTVGDASVGKFWHKASIVGLEINTEYVYSVSNDKNIYSDIYEFKTSPANAFRFAVTGDPQLTEGLQDNTSGRRDETTLKGWQDTMAAIAARGVEFIAGVGDQVDLTNNGSEAEYTNFYAPNALRSIPFAPAIGNHDRHYLFNYHWNIPNEMSFTPIINAGNAANQQYQIMEVAGNYWYAYNNALFVVLNDSGYPENKEVAGMYITNFRATLTAAVTANPGYTWLFVQHHKSTASVADHCADRDIQYYVEAGFERLMDEFNVDFVLAGHDHVYARSYPMFNGSPDKTGTVIPIDNSPISGGDGAPGAVNPNGTVYFTTTTASGLKYYELFNNANNLYVKDNLYYPYLVDGKIGSVEYMNGNLPLSNAKYLQDKTPGYLYVEVDGDAVTFSYYNLDDYADTPYDTYTVNKTDVQLTDMTAYNKAFDDFCAYYDTATWTFRKDLFTDYTDESVLEAERIMGAGGQAHANLLAAYGKLAAGRFDETDSADVVAEGTIILNGAIADMMAAIVKKEDPVTTYTVRILNFFAGVAEDITVYEGDRIVLPTDFSNTIKWGLDWIKPEKDFTGNWLAFVDGVWKPLDGIVDNMIIVTSNITIMPEAAEIAKPVTLTNAVTTAKDFISIVETAKNSRVWVMSFRVTETYSDKTTKAVTYTINLNGNNANLDGKFKFGNDHALAGYTLVYDIKGNGSNIKEFKLIK